MIPVDMFPTPTTTRLAQTHVRRVNSRQRRVEERRRRPRHRLGHDQVPKLRVPGNQQRRHHTLADEPHGVGDEHHCAPWQPVGEHTADEEEDDERDRPSREDVAEVGDRPRQVEDRERQRHADDPVAEQGDRLAREEQPELALVQGSERLGDAKPHESAAATWRRPRSRMLVSARAPIASVWTSGTATNTGVTP